MAKGIEKQFAELLAQVRAQFPEWQVHMNIMVSRYDRPGDPPTCAIQLMKQPVMCSECGTIKTLTGTEIAAYKPTFAECLTEVTAKVAELEG